MHSIRLVAVCMLFDCSAGRLWTSRVEMPNIQCLTCRRHNHNEQGPFAGRRNGRRLPPNSLLVPWPDMIAAGMTRCCTQCMNAGQRAVIPDSLRPLLFTPSTDLASAELLLSVAHEQRADDSNQLSNDCSFQVDSASFYDLSSIQVDSRPPSPAPSSVQLTNPPPSILQQIHHPLMNQLQFANPPRCVQFPAPITAPPIAPPSNPTVLANSNISQPVTAVTVVERRVSFPIWNKRKMVKEVDESPNKKVARMRLGLSASTVSHMRAYIRREDALPESERTPQGKRRRGGGRAPMLIDVEGEIREWIIKQRRGPPARAVSLADIIRFASNKYACRLRQRTLSNRWVQNFLRRARLSFRRRTTIKDLDSPAILDIAAAYRVLHRRTFERSDLRVVYNMDETGVTFDAPATRTVEVKGAKAVHITTSGHDKDRVTVVLCVSAAGQKLPPLIIHRKPVPRLKPERSNLAAVNKAKAKQNLIRREIIKYTTYKRVADKRTGEERIVEAGQKEDAVYLSENSSAYMNTTLMHRWLTEVYAQHDVKLPVHERLSKQTLVEPWKRSALFLDNMSAHYADVVEEAADALTIQLELLPPYCTPLLQPLDHSLNAAFKVSIREQWRLWFGFVSQQGAAAKTKWDNWKKAPKSTMNGWILAAWNQITEQQCVNSFRHTLCGQNELAAAQQRLDERKSRGEPDVVIPRARNRQPRSDGGAAVTVIEEKRYDDQEEEENEDEDEEEEDVNEIAVGEDDDKEENSIIIDEESNEEPIDSINSAASSTISASTSSNSRRVSSRINKGIRRQP